MAYGGTVYVVAEVGTDDVMRACAVRLNGFIEALRMGRSVLTGGERLILSCLWGGVVVVSGLEVGGGSRWTPFYPGR